LWAGDKAHVEAASSRGGSRFGGEDPIVSCEPDVIVSLTVAEFRRLVVLGCIAAIQRYPEAAE
jgi:hypothetical protein